MSRGLVLAAVGALALASCREATSFPDDVKVNPARTGGSDGRGGTGGVRASGGSSAASQGGAGGEQVPPVDAIGPADSGDASAGDDGGGAVAEVAPEVGGTARALRFVDVALWSKNADGAYSIVHEGVCDQTFISTVNMAPAELKSRGIKAAFGVISNACETGRHWPKIKAMADDGHEILNGGHTGACLTRANMYTMACGGAMSPRSNDYAVEIDRSNMLIQSNTGAGPGVLIPPYDVCDPAMITYIKGKGFFGSRCGPARSNNANFPDPFAIKFDLWGPAFSAYKTMAMCGNVAAGAMPSATSANCRRHVLNAPVDEAINAKAWVMRGFHSFDANSYQPVTIADYRMHLDYVKTKQDAGQVWVAGPTEIVKYRFARQHCPKPTLSASNVLSFGAPNADCMKYATRLSYVVNTMDGGDLATLASVQGGQRLVARKIGTGAFAIDADPTKGDATLVE